MPVASKKVLPICCHKTVGCRGKGEKHWCQVICKNECACRNRCTRKNGHAGPCDCLSSTCRLPLAKRTRQKPRKKAGYPVEPTPDFTCEVILRPPGDGTPDRTRLLQWLNLQHSGTLHAPERITTDHLDSHYHLASSYRVEVHFRLRRDGRADILFIDHLGERNSVHPPLLIEEPKKPEEAQKHLAESAESMRGYLSTLVDTTTQAVLDQAGMKLVASSPSISPEQFADYNPPISEPQLPIGNTCVECGSFAPSGHEMCPACESLKNLGGQP